MSTQLVIVVTQPKKSWHLTANFMLKLWHGTSGIASKTKARFNIGRVSFFSFDLNGFYFIVKLVYIKEILIFTFKVSLSNISLFHVKNSY